MKKFIIYYSNASSSSYETVVIRVKSLNDAISQAKSFCRNYHSQLLGVVDASVFSDVL